MSDVNIITLSGRIGTTPEGRYTPNGFLTCQLNLAVSEWKKNADNGKGGQGAETTHWIRCLFLGNTAERLLKSCQKGQKILIEGRIQQESWVDKDSGTKRSATQILVSRMHILSWNRDQNQQG